MEASGATLVDVAIPEPLQSTWGMMSPAVTAEFKPQIEAYLANLANNFPKSLIAINAMSTSPEIVNSATPVNPGRIDGFIEAQASPGLADTGYLYLVTNTVPTVRSQIQALMAAADVDAIIYPTIACPASPLFNVEDDTYSCDVGAPYTAGYLANITEFPDITVPMGYTTHGLPVGLSFMADAYSEPQLIGFAYAFEQANPVRQSPDTTPALDGEEFDY
jgi:amidase